MISKEQDRLWKAFYDSARHNEVLGERINVMIHLAAAMALGCEP